MFPPLEAAVWSAVSVTQPQAEPSRLFFGNRGAALRIPPEEALVGGRIFRMFSAGCISGRQSPTVFTSFPK